MNPSFPNQSSSNSASEASRAWLETPGVRALLERAARDGEISYDAINTVLGDAAVDAGDIELLLEALEQRGIDVTEESFDEPAQTNAVNAPTSKPQSSASQQPQQSRAKKSHAKKEGVQLEAASTGHADLDAALASLEELLAHSDGGESLLREDDAGDEMTDESGPAVEDAFKQYLNGMGRVPLLSAEEELRLARLLRDGTPEEKTRARQQLVEANLRLVVHVARRYSSHALLPMLDIVQEGNIGLMKAIDRFDPDRGHRLSTYATWWIRQSIRRAVAEQSRSIRLPAQLAESIQTVQRLQRAMTQSLGRAPSHDELAQAAGLTLPQVEEAMRAASQPLSLDSPMGEEDDLQLGDMLSDEHAETPASALGLSELREGLETAMETLTDRERLIIGKRFGLGDYGSGGAQTLEDVAGELNLSRERVRQLEIRALRKLRRRTRGTSLGLLLEGDDDDES